MTDEVKLDCALKLPAGYQTDNPKIIEKIRKDMASGDPYHYWFQGKVGTGKTFTARAIVQSYPNHFEYYPSNNPIAKSGMIIVRDYYREYLDFNKLHGAGGVLDIKANEKLMNKRFLCIDDIGNEKAGVTMATGADAAHEYIGSIIERRYEQIKRNYCHATIITTNLDGKQLKKMYGSRVLDRIFEVFQIMKFERGIDLLGNEKESHRRENASEPIKG